MNRSLFGFALAAIMIVSSCQKISEQDSGMMDPVLKKAQLEQTDGEVIPGQYLVIFNDFPGLPQGKAVGYNEGIARAREVVMSLMNDHKIPAEKLGFVYAFALDGFSANLTDDQVIKLLNDRRVKYIEPDQVISISGSQSNATWGIDRVDQRALPLNQTYTWDATGTGVTAYIIDTGIRYSHNEFGGRATFGYDAFGGNGADQNGHGTHVAGTVGGATYGVAKDVSLVAVRVLDRRGSGTTTGVIAGMDWVVSNKKLPAVANMSLGGGISTATDDAVARMFIAGVPVIVAAGNSSQPACNYSPARAPEAYTVGATTNTDAKASYSNYGNCVNLFAPGSSITSAWHTSNTAINTISGTSMASPHVAGGAALFLEKNPGATAQQVYDALTNNSTKNKVTSSNTTNNHLLYTLGFGGGDTDPIAVTGVSLSPSSASLELNATVQIVATVSPDNADNKNVTWSSNNTSVATVNIDGFVKAVGEGSARITVTTVDGNYTATSTISVTDSGGGEVGNNPPTIETFNITKSTAGPWRRAIIDWDVSDEDSDLSTVKLELLNGDTVLESTNISVTGSNASGSNELRSRTDHTAVRITVTDSENHSISATKGY